MKPPKMSFSRWMINKLWSIQTRGYYPLLKRNKLSSYEKAQKDLKWILLSQRKSYNRLWKAAYCMITATWHTGKDKLWASEKIVGYRGLIRGGGMNKQKWGFWDDKNYSEWYYIYEFMLLFINSNSPDSTTKNQLWDDLGNVASPVVANVSW